MTLPFIKVCGIQNIDEAQGVIARGANTIGLLVGVTHVSEDNITEERAKRIVDAVPRSIRTVMVTHLLDPDRIAAIANGIGVDAIQVHGDVPVDGIRHLRKVTSGTELLKAIHVTGEEALDSALHFKCDVDMLLLDSRTKDRLGGTGETHDWNISRKIVQAVDIPVILAGGLRPSNVVEAIERVQPAGIDANSGIEHEDGSKDLEKVARFVAAGLQCTFKCAT